MTTTAPDLRDGATAALRLIETGPNAVRCTHCHAQPGQPCHNVDTGRHHRERLWQTRNQTIATLRTALSLPPVDGLTAA